MEKSQNYVDEKGRFSMPVYEVFPGIRVFRMKFRMEGFTEERQKSDQLEINFCVNGRFECEFTNRDVAILKPGDMAVSRFDGKNGRSSYSRFPIGYYEGLCVLADCGRATEWMKQSFGVFATDMNRLRDELLREHWYWAGEAGYQCEHVFREIYDGIEWEEQTRIQLKIAELLMLIRQFPRTEKTRIYCPADQISLIRHIRDHMITNSDSWMSVEELAAEHGMSVSQLQKLFRDQYGMPIYRYLREYRLEQAAVALTGTRKPIMEIAQNAGFSNASKFSEGFRRRYGMTPSAYRKAYNENFKIRAEMEQFSRNGVETFLQCGYNDFC